MTDKPITLQPLPEPTLENVDYELWGQNVKTDCFTPEQMQAYARAAVLADRASNATSQGMADGTKLWLWKNGDHYLAFGSAYPCFEPGGDPMTLGEPAAVAVFKASFDRHASAPPAPTLTAAVDAVAGEPVARCFEFWHGDRKVTMYPDACEGDQPMLLKVWGPNIHHEMESVPLTDTNAVRAAFDWLYATPPRAGSETTASASVQAMCACGDRPASECDEEWGPKCDLGNNAAHARVAAPVQGVMGAEVAGERNRGVLTYKNQPGNVGAWRLGEACRNAADAPAGDPIDRGLLLLKELQERGYGVVALPETGE